MSVYIIAEAGICHNGNIDTAYDMIKVAAEAGADAVKFQAFNAERLGRPELKQYELYLGQYYGLKRCCDDHGVDFLCSCFDTEWLKLLEPLMSKIKIPSSKLSDVKYISECGHLNKEIILSTGLSDFDEIDGVMYGIEWGQKITIMHCTTDYPPNINDLNLSCIKRLAEIYEMPVGYSDHTRYSTASVMAVAMGATVIEKHFTLDSDQEGPDHHMSCEPHELWHFIENTRYAEKMLGDGVIRVEKGAEKNLWIKEQYNLSKEKE